MPVGLSVMWKRRLGDRPATLVAASDRPDSFPIVNMVVCSFVQHFQIVRDTSRAGVKVLMVMGNAGDVEIVVVGVVGSCLYLAGRGRKLSQLGD